MEIIFALLIPIIITLFAYLIWHHKFVWWELFIPITSVLIVTLIIKFSVEKTLVTFTEYWGSTVVAVYEEEPYNEWVQQTCSRQYACGSDGKGNTIYCTEYYDCSYQNDEGPKWYVITNLDEKLRVTEQYYEMLKKRWENPVVSIKERRNHAPNDRCYNSKGTKFEGKRVGQISRVYRINWDTKDITREPISSKHKYKNKVKASDLSIFNISLVTPAQADSFNLFDYPVLFSPFTYPTVLGYNDKFIQKRYQQLNGKFGTSNKLRLWVLVFDNTDPNIGLLQENYWVRGNKNELVICIGKDKEGNIVWSRVFSWCKSEQLKLEIRDKVLDLKKINNKSLMDLHSFLNVNLKKFEKRSFKEFEYLSIELPTTTLIWIYSISFILSMVITIWSINNEDE